MDPPVPCGSQNLRTLNPTPRFKGVGSRVQGPPLQALVLGVAHPIRPISLSVSVGHPASEVMEVSTTTHFPKGLKYPCVSPQPQETKDVVSAFEALCPYKMRHRALQKMLWTVRSKVETMGPQYGPLTMGSSYIPTYYIPYIYTVKGPKNRPKKPKGPCQWPMLLTLDWSSDAGPRPNPRNSVYPP